MVKNELLRRLCKRRIKPPARVAPPKRAAVVGQTTEEAGGVARVRPEEKRDTSRERRASESGLRRSTTENAPLGCARRAAIAKRRSIKPRHLFSRR